MEPMSATAMTFGAILLLASWVQLLFVSFGDDYNWGLSTLFAPPLGYLYGLFSWEKAQSALVMAGIGWVLILFALL